jgi:exonuclease III
VKNNLKIEQTTGNEYALHIKITLPNSQRINIVNIYLPPVSSLTKRAIPETEAIESIEEIVNALQPQLQTIICGDFNARIGSRTPTLEDGHPPRTAVDTYICKRAPWLIHFCT